MNKPVKQILNWVDYGNVGIRAEVRHDDDSVSTRNYDYDEWQKVKDEELEYEIIYLIELTTNRYGLCAWCKSYFSRQTGRPIHKLSHERFEQTRHTGQSHGMCEECKQSMNDEIEKSKIYSYKTDKNNLDS